MKEITNRREASEFLKNKKCVIFYGKHDCGHCQSIHPFYNSLEAKYPNISFAHVEVSKVKCKNIKMVPVFVLYENGKPRSKSIGSDQNDLNKLLTL